MSEEEIVQRLDLILETLNRIEARQIVVKGEVEAQTAPVVGSFASSDLGETKKGE